MEYQEAVEQIADTYGDPVTNNISSLMMSYQVFLNGDRRYNGVEFIELCCALRQAAFDLESFLEE